MRRALRGPLVVTLMGVAMSRATLSFLFLAGAVVFLVLAVVTMLPFSASSISDLGYYSLCPFAPWSTLMLLFAAGLSWVLRRHVDKQPK
jgi:hypothetical protein